MNRNTDFLKIIGIVSMFLDHLGAIFYPHIALLRIIGRIAFPIFAYQIGVGYQNTSNLAKYLFRLLMIGIISQFPFALLFSQTLNIFFTLTIGLLSISVYDRLNPALGLLLPFVGLLFKLEYGLYGVYLILLFFVLQKKPYLLHLSLIGLNLIYYLWYDTGLQLYSLLALPFILLPRFILPFQLSRFWFYAFYPFHLVIMLILTLC